jgi:uncharacterized protein (TIGR02444 family)
MTQLRSDVWSFALALYDRPGVSEACLTLQDEHAADVVLLIGICWLSLRRPEALQASDIARLEAALAPWREAAVVPLRTIRRSLKPRLAALPAAAADLREQIKAAELQAERVAFEILENAASAADARPACAAPVQATLMLYLSGLGNPYNAELQGLAERLAMATYEVSGLPHPPGGAQATWA